jgi:hypothetical protein
VAPVGMPRPAPCPAPAAALAPRAARPAGRGADQSTAASGGSGTGWPLSSASSLRTCGAVDSPGSQSNSAGQRGRTMRCGVAMEGQMGTSIRFIFRIWASVKVIVRASGMDGGDAGEWDGACGAMWQPGYSRDATPRQLRAQFGSCAAQQRKGGTPSSGPAFRFEHAAQAANRSCHSSHAPTRKKHCRDRLPTAMSVVR